MQAGWLCGLLCHLHVKHAAKATTLQSKGQAAADYVMQALFLLPLGPLCAHPVLLACTTLELGLPHKAFVVHVVLVVIPQCRLCQRVPIALLAPTSLA